MVVRGISGVKRYVLFVHGHDFFVDGFGKFGLFFLKAGKFLL